MTKNIKKSAYSLFILLDFLLTYTGIHLYKIIEEGNPFMVWIFEVPFIVSYLIVASMVVLIYLLCEKISSYDKYNWVFHLFNVRNLFILTLHLNWIRLCY